MRLLGAASSLTVDVQPTAATPGAVVSGVRLAALGADEWRAQVAFGRRFGETGWADTRIAGDPGTEGAPRPAADRRRAGRSSRRLALPNDRFRRKS